MPRGTTRRRKQRGGVVGSLASAEELGLYYLGAHGFMTDRVVKVPANTYILFVAPSGEVCEPTGKDTRLYDSLILGRRFKSAEEFSKGWADILTGATESTPHGFSLYRRGAAGPATVGIYEPGDSFHDLQLEFSNDLGSKFIDMGLYHAPLAANYLKTCETIWGYFEKKYPTGDIPVKDVAKLSKFYSDGDAVYAEREDNMMKLPVRAVNLSTLLETPEKAGVNWPAGKRVIIVNACRIPLEPTMPVGPARRLSLSQRRNLVEPSAAATTTGSATTTAPPKPKSAAKGFKKGFLKGGEP